MRAKYLIKHISVLIVLFIIGMVVSISSMDLPMPDFLNFHYYNGWAFINHRLNIDVMPTLFRTYFNPVIDVYSYYQVEKFNNNVFLYYLVDNLWYTAYLFLSYLIFDLVFRRTKANIILIISGLLLTTFSPTLIIVLNFLSAMPTNVLTLLAVYLLLQFIVLNKDRTYLLVCSAFLFGLSMGIKYTIGSFTFAFIVCILYNRRNLKNVFVSFFQVLSALFIGFMIGGGWWMCYVYSRFHNPIYPYLNNIFNPSDGDVSSLLLQDFIVERAKNIVDFLFYPFFDIKERFFNDIKLLLSYVAICLYFIFYKSQKLNDIIKNVIEPQLFKTILLFVVITYFINLSIFAQTRYIVSLFPLLAIIITVAIYVIMQYLKNLPWITKILVAFVLCFVIIMVSLKIYDWKYVIVISLIYIAYSNIRNKKEIYATLLIILFLCNFNLLKYQIFSSVELYLKKSIIEVENLQIKDNAAVLISSGTSFIIPSQNKKAVYAGFTVPRELSSVEENKNNHPDIYFQNKMLEKSIREIFELKKDIYLLFNSAKVLPESCFAYIRYYSNDAAKKIDINDCAKVDSKILGRTDFINSVYKNIGEIYFCKVK